MTDPKPRGGRWPAALARALLRLYPKSFSGRWGHAYLEAAHHRWRVEWTRSPSGAGIRTAWILIADAARAVPAAWRDAWLERARTAECASTLERSTWTRHARGGRTMARWLEGWMWDVRVASRGLARRPALSFLVVGTLALAIGANSAIYGALDRIVLRPLPFEGADRAVYVMSRDEARGFTFSVEQTQYDRWREGARSFEALEAFQPEGATLVREGEVEQLDGVAVSLGLAGAVGAAPVAGRGFTVEDVAPDAPPTVMLSEDYWRGELGADPGVIGSTLTMSDVSRTVVGIWPRGGRFRIEDEPSYFTPLARGSEIDRSSFSIVLGILEPGVDAEDASTELAALSRGLEESDPGGANPADVPALLPVHAFVSGDFIQALWILFAGVGLLLLVAGVNGANLLLNRAIDRERELGVRMALGGSRTRLLRHFLLEGGILALLGAIAGLAVAKPATLALAAFAPPDIPAAALAGGSDRTVPYTVLLVVALTLVCGVVPAAHLRSKAVRGLMGRGTAHPDSERRLLKAGLITGQVAFASVLTMGSVLTLRSLDRVSAIDFGFSTDELVIVSVRAPVGVYADEGGSQERRELATRVRDALATIPSVTAVSVSGVLPLSYSIRFGTPYLEGEQPAVEDGSFSQTATSAPDFLAATGVTLLAGRDFTEDERNDVGPGVVLVNRGFAESRSGSVLGRSLRFPGDSVGRRIVGIVGDVRTGNVKDATVRAQVYRPSDGVSTGRSQRYLVRASQAGGTLATLIRERIRRVDPELLVTSVSTGRELVRERTAGSRFLAVILGVLGLLSTSLALAGVYGAVTLSVARRLREIGIRLALGAASERVAGHVVSRSMRPVAAGLLLGLVGAWLAAAYLGDVLYEVSPRDPISFVVTAAVVSGAAVLAALFPAGRAARVDPTEMLRAE